jgi:hypothetical protein
MCERMCTGRVRIFVCVTLRRKLFVQLCLVCVSVCIHVCEYRYEYAQGVCMCVTLRTANVCEDMYVCVCVCDFEGCTASALCMYVYTHAHHLRKA